MPSAFSENKNLPAKKTLLIENSKLLGKNILLLHKIKFVLEKFYFSWLIFFPAVKIKLFLEEQKARACVLLFKIDASNI